MLIERLHAQKLWQLMLEKFQLIQPQQPPYPDAWWEKFYRETRLTNFILRQTLYSGLNRKDNRQFRMSENFIKLACSYIDDRGGRELQEEILSGKLNSNSLTAANNQDIIETIKTTIEDSMELAVKAYLSNVKPILPTHYGEYNVYWLKTDDDPEVAQRYTITIHSKGAIINMPNGSISGVIEYQNNSLYLTFESHEKTTKKRMIVIHVGIVNEIKYASALFLSTTQNGQPVSGPMLIVKLKGEYDNEDFANRFFDKYYYQYHRFQAKTIDVIRSFAKGKKERIEGLFGSWYIYVWSEDNNDIFRAKVNIKSRSQIDLVGEKHSYKGQIDMYSHNFSMNIRYETRPAQIIGHIGAGEIDNLNWIHCVLSITSLDKDIPKVGLAVMERVINEEFNSMKTAKFKESRFSELPEIVSKALIGNTKNIMALDTLEND